MNNPADTLAALAPCPFCEQSRAVLSNTRELGCQSTRFMYAVVCDATADGCGATGGFHEESADAIASWNRRASLKGEAERPMFWISAADLARANAEGDNVIACPATGEAPEDSIFLYTTPPDPQADQDTDMMAECMIECREGLIATGIIEASVPPMFVAEAVIAKFRSLTRPTPSPAPQGGGEAQSSEANELLRSLGLDPDRFRSEGGHPNPWRIKAAILRPEDYSGLYLASDHLFSHSANLGGEVCERCGAVKKTRRGNAPCRATPPAQQPGEVGELKAENRRLRDALAKIEGLLTAALAPKEKGNG